jgi:hypothetical protein
LLNAPYGRAKLAFSQLAHWNVYRLRERFAIRQIASATRLRGRLHLKALENSLAEMFRRHDALRTRIVLIDGTPMQIVDKQRSYALVFDDLVSLPESAREAEVLSQIDSMIMQPIDVSADPLYGMKLLRIREMEYVLIIALEHMISDAFSMSILLRDLFIAYDQASQGLDISLPPIPVQFIEFAIQQRRMLQVWRNQHEAHWNKHLTGYQRLKFPESQRNPDASRRGWGIVPVQIDKDLKTALTEWCRVKRTTLVMSVFAAYAAHTLRWCRVSASVFQYLVDGRVHRTLESTIGYFACPLFLKIELCEQDRFEDLVNRSMEEYCEAFEHADFSYLESQEPRPDFARSSAFNWVPLSSGLHFSSFPQAGNDIVCSAVPFEHPMLRNLERDNDPVLLLYESEYSIAGGIRFPLNRFAANTMEQFGSQFCTFLQALLQEPERRVRDIALDQCK